jgi:hypothetical protein
VPACVHHWPSVMAGYLVVCTPHAKRACCISRMCVCWYHTKGSMAGTMYSRATCVSISSIADPHVFVNPPSVVCVAHRPPQTTVSFPTSEYARMLVPSWMCCMMVHHPIVLLWAPRPGFETPPHRPLVSGTTGCLCIDDALAAGMPPCVDMPPPLPREMWGCCA